MIGFEDEVVDILNLATHECGGIAKICHPCQFADRVEEVVLAPGKQVSHRVISVVGDGEGRDLQVTELEALASSEELPLHLALEVLLDGPCGVFVGKKFQMPVAGKALYARSVVGVLVRNEYGIHVLDAFTCCLQHLADPLAREPRVN